MINLSKATPPIQKDFNKKKNKGRGVNKKWLKLAKGHVCMRCPSYHGVVMAHMQIDSADTGRGMGLKGDDEDACPLCSTCHPYMDNYEGVTAKFGTMEHESQILKHENEWRRLVSRFHKEQKALGNIKYLGDKNFQGNK